MSLTRSKLLDRLPCEIWSDVTSEVASDAVSVEEFAVLIGRHAMIGVGFATRELDVHRLVLGIVANGLDVG